MRYKKKARVEVLEHMVLHGIANVLNGMAHVSHFCDDIWLGKAYVRYLITNFLAGRPFQGSRPHRYCSYQRYNRNYAHCQPS